MLLESNCHPDVILIFYGRRLIAPEKKSGGVRLITIGYTLRRIAANELKTLL